MTDKKAPQTTEENKAKETASVVDSPAKTPSKDKVDVKTTKPERKPSSVSPRQEKPVKAGNGLAIFAILLSLVAMAGVGGVFYWYQQQLIALNDETKKQQAAQEQRLSEQSQRQVLALLNKQQQQVTAFVEKSQANGSAEVAQLAHEINSLKQTRSSDWLLHEAQYLVRIASRALWLEDDARGAITLLKDADNRLQALNDPNLLPIREAIHQDIEQLSLLPALESESVILALMGLEKQVESLPLALAYKPESVDAEPDLTLSENTDDWRENLYKSWQQFTKDFITIRRRTADVEPLLSPKQQHNLQQNLSLKLQVSQWAVTRKDVALFEQSLTEAQSWLSAYYDVEQSTVINFNQRLETLKSATIKLTLPTTLRSLTMIGDALKDQPLPVLPKTKEPVEEVEPTVASSQEEQA